MRTPAPANCQVMLSWKMAIASTAPMKGANEKYAPVRAVPRWRRPSMNMTRLTPTPRKPTNAPAPIKPALGSDAPSDRARTRLVEPATRPLIMAISTGSADESLRVRLLSMPQLRQAAAMNRLPVSRLRPSPVQDSSTAPARMAAAPRMSCRSTFSLNTIHAIAMVARPSRFSNKDPEEALVCDRPNIRNRGPSMPPNTTTAASQGMSARRSGASGDGNSINGRTTWTIASPRPAPR